MKMIDYSKYDEIDMQIAIKNYYVFKIEAYRCMIQEGKQAYLDHIRWANSCLYMISDLPTNIFPNGPEMMYEKFIYVYADPNNETVQLFHKFRDALKKYKEEKEK